MYDGFQGTARNLLNCLSPLAPVSGVNSTIFLAATVSLLGVATTEGDKVLAVTAFGSLSCKGNLFVVMSGSRGQSQSPLLPDFKIFE